MLSKTKSHKGVLSYMDSNIQKRVQYQIDD